MRFLGLGAAAMLCVGFVGNAVADGFFEFRTGFAAGGGESTGTLGVALGYDHKFGSGVFLGGEIAYDARSDFADSLAGVNLRFGTQVSESAKAFVTVGRIWQDYSSSSVFYIPGLMITTTTSQTFYDTVAGVGYQADLSESAYFSVQYQHAFDLEADRAMIGVGVTF